VQDYARAEKGLRELVKKPPPAAGSGPLTLDLARCLYAQGQLSEAATLSKELLDGYAAKAAAPEREETYRQGEVLRALVLRDLGLLGEAASLLRRAHETFKTVGDLTGMVEVSDLLADTFHRQEDHLEARAWDQRTEWLLGGRPWAVASPTLLSHIPFTNERAFAHRRRRQAQHYVDKGDASAAEAELWPCVDVYRLAVEEAGCTARLEPLLLCLEQLGSLREARGTGKVILAEVKEAREIIRLLQEPPAVGESAPDKEGEHSTSVH
jgi:tetratricopeptide (TPR) repeat protein